MKIKIVKGKFWLDIFSEANWEEFIKKGGNVTVFPGKRKKTAEKILPGDYFICYVTEASKFVGVLQVKSPYYTLKARVGENEIYPIRFDVEFLYKLDIKTGIHIHSLKDRLSIFRDLKSPNKWTWYFRMTLQKIKDKDGKIILEAIRKNVDKP